MSYATCVAFTIPQGRDRCIEQQDSLGTVPLDRIQEAASFIPLFRNLAIRNTKYLDHRSYYLLTRRGNTLILSQMSPTPDSTQRNSVSLSNQHVNGNLHIRKTGTNHSEIVFHPSRANRLIWRREINEVRGEQFVHYREVSSIESLFKDKANEVLVFFYRHYYPSLQSSFEK